MKKKINLISIIIFSILTIISILLFGLIINLNIIPFKYLITIIIVYVIILFILGFISFKKKFKVWVKIFNNVISVALTIILIMIFYYLNSTLHFMDKIKAEEYQIENYYVLINMESDIDDVEDINTLGIYGKSESYKDALSELSKENNYTPKKYDSYVELGNSLLEGKNDAILLSASYKEILSEIIPKFEENVKIIYVIETKSENGIETNEINVSNQSFNIYISGIDVYGDINMISRSDVNMIITVNPNTHEILLTSIPRDYYVQLHDTTGSRDKLTHAGLYGINMSIETIEDLLEVDIDYYVRVNFSTLVSLVDAIEGIDVYSDAAFTAWTDRTCHYYVGMMHLDGKCALAFARERMTYIDGDRHRVKNQQDVISAIMKKALSSRTLITKYTNILESMGSSFQTNIPTDKIYDLINMQLDSMPSWNFDTYSLNGFDSTNSTYTFGDQQLYVMEPDVNTVNQARNKIDKVMGK